MDPDESPDELKPENEPENETAEDGNAESGNGERHRKRTRRRIKIRKRVKIKRKTSPKKKAKKLLETVAWVLVMAAFLITLVMLILQLDFSSKHRQRKRTELLPKNHTIVIPEINNGKIA
jgi:hypothetical protein